MDIQLLVSLLIGAGFLLAVVSLVLAYRDARRQVRIAGEQIELAQRLFKQEQDELAQRTEEEKKSGEFAVTIHHQYDEIHTRHGIIRATYDNSPFLPAMHAQRVLKTIVDSSRSNLIWAGIGLAVSTGASIWGLWPS